MRLRGSTGNLGASNLDISVISIAQGPLRFNGSLRGCVALKKHLTKPPESRGSLFPKGAHLHYIEDQGDHSLVVMSPAIYQGTRVQCVTMCLNTGK